MANGDGSTELKKEAFCESKEEQEGFGRAVLR
jgi:hypothetical protein